MNSISKRLAVVEDRISALPDAVLCHILSFLRTKYAVRTTVLSRRWKNIWTSVTCLDFNDSEDFTTTGKGCCGSERFMTFVDRVLSCNSSDIQKFRLTISYPDGLACIDSWIWTAVRRNVVELDFCLYADDFIYFELPQSLVMCKTLKVLKLSSNTITCALPTPGCFPSLKFLHVTVHYPDNYTISKLFSHCPVLEDLTIDGDVIVEEVIDFIISAPKLKMLQISLSVDDPDCVYNLFIDAPMLENLDIKLDILSNYVLESAKSLVKANIALDHCIEEQRPAFSNRLTALLAQVCNVTYLSLSACCFEAGDLPSFNNLKQLKLVLCDCSCLELLVEVLKRSANLKDLFFENGECYHECSVPQWNPPGFVPICLLSHLKTIAIQGFKGREVEMELAEYLLKNGRVLDKMIIDTSLRTKEDLCEKFAMFRRGSVACEVEFIKM